MSTNPLPRAHVWASPAWCAERLSGTRTGENYRAKCPVHGGDSTQTLSIRHGRDTYGNPKTLLHCFGHKCDVRDICAALGIEVYNLYSVREEHHEYMKRFPPAKSPRIAKLRRIEEPTPDEIAQILLEEMIVSDPEWIMTCVPAQQKLWELAHVSADASRALRDAVRKAGLDTQAFWSQLRREQEG